jgi:hypothetical protein
MYIGRKDGDVLGRWARFMVGSGDMLGARKPFTCCTHCRRISSAFLRPLDSATSSGRGSPWAKLSTAMQCIPSFGEEANN